MNSNILIPKMLSRKRIGLAAVEEGVMTNIFRTEGLNIDDFEPVILLDKKEMYYAFHKDTPDSVIEKFQRAFDELKKSGKVDEIIKKYRKTE